MALGKKKIIFKNYGEGPTPPPGLDSDAVAAVNAIETNGTAIRNIYRNALSDMFVGLKGAGIYSKIKCLYIAIPEVGEGLSFSPNLVKPGTYNMGYNNVGNISFDGAFKVNSSLGSSYAGNGIIIPNVFTANNIHLMCISTADWVYNPAGNDAGNVMGAWDGTSPGDQGVFFQMNSTQIKVQIGLSANAAIKTSPTSTKGRFFGSRVSGTDIRLYKDGAQIANNTNNETGGITTNPASGLLFASIDRGGNNPGQGTSQSFLAFGAGDGLTSSEISIYDGLLSTFMNAIQRSATPVALPSLTDYLLYILAGQSNCGRSRSSDMTGGQAAAYAGLVPGCKIITSDHGVQKPTDAQFQDMNVGVNTYLTNYIYTNEFGPEAALFRALGAGYLLKNGIGSSYISGWMPGGSTYAWFRKMVFNAFVRMADLGYKPSIMFIWAQGEAEATDATLSAGYGTALANWMTAVASLMSEISGYMGFVAPSVINKRIMRITTVSGTYSAGVRSAQAAYCADSSNHAVMIDTDSYPLMGDNLHYNATGQIQFGTDIFNSL